MRADTTVEIPHQHGESVGIELGLSCGNEATEQTHTLLRSTVTVVGGSVSQAAPALWLGDPIDGSNALNNIGPAALTQVPARLSLAFPGLPKILGVQNSRAAILAVRLTLRWSQC